MGDISIHSWEEHILGRLGQNRHFVYCKACKSVLFLFNRVQKTLLSVVCSNYFVYTKLLARGFSTPIPVVVRNNARVLRSHQPSSRRHSSAWSISSGHSGGDIHGDSSRRSKSALIFRSASTSFRVMNCHRHFWNDPPLST